MVSLGRLKATLAAFRARDEAEASRQLKGVEASGLPAIALAIACYLDRRPHRAATILREVAKTDDARTRVLALRTQADLCGELGWNHETRQALTQWLAMDPGARAARRRAVDLLARGRDWTGAEALLRGPEAASMPLRRAGVLRELGRGREAADLLITLKRETLSEPARQRLAGLLARCGSLDQALDVLEAGPASARLLADRSRLLLFLGRTADGSQCAREAVAAGADGDSLDRAETSIAIARLLDGVDSLASVQPGHPAAADARERLEAVLARSPLHGEAQIWLGQALAILGESEAALVALDLGVPAVGGFDLGAALLRHLIEQRSSSSPLGFGPRSLEELSEGLSRLGIPREEAHAVRRLVDLEATFGVALQRLGGNRSGDSTVLGGSEARALGPSISPRSAARHTLELIRVCGPEAVLSRFAEVEEAWSDSSMGIVHRGELLMWLGRYEEAREAFQGTLTINPFTRWGWIGQLGSEAFLGDPEQALELGAEGVKVMGGYGPSHYVYRGEALRLLGQHDEARKDLEYAVRVGPSRLGARITLALICAEQGDDESMRAHLPALRRACAGMLATALEEEGEPASLVWGAEPSATQMRPVLSRAHRMMRGNRSSSCHTWFSGDGTLRLNEDGGAMSDPFRARMDDRLAQAAAILAAGNRWLQ